MHGFCGLFKPKKGYLEVFAFTKREIFATIYLVRKLIRKEFMAILIIGIVAGLAVWLVTREENKGEWK